MKTGSAQTSRLPKVDPWLRTWFLWYAKRYTRRRFHTVRLSRSSRLPQEAPSLVLYSNHASWWDPMMAAVLSGALMPQRTGFAPIDARALKQYPFFRRLGFFGVDPSSALGVRGFLRTSEAILNSLNTFLWITPQSRFADVRERPLEFARGLSRLQDMFPNIPFVPVAIEYPFWEERAPEALVHIGEPASTGLEEALGEAMDYLAELSIGRVGEEFFDLTRREVGVGGVYDVWRRMRQALSSGSTRPSLNHGQR